MYFTDNGRWAPERPESDGSDISWLQAFLSVEISEGELYVTRDPTYPLDHDRPISEWESAAWDEVGLARQSFDRHMSKVMEVLYSDGSGSIAKQWLEVIDHLRRDQPLDEVIAAAFKISNLDKRMF